MAQLFYYALELDVVELSLLIINFIFGEFWESFFATVLALKCKQTVAHVRVNPRIGVWLVPTTVFGRKDIEVYRFAIVGFHIRDFVDKFGRGIFPIKLCVYVQINDAFSEWGYDIASWHLDLA